MVGEMNYSSNIPQEAIQNAEREILNYMNQNKDGYFARSLLYVRRLTNPNVRKDIVRRVDLAASEDGISQAKLMASGTVPDITKTKKKDNVHQVWFIADSVLCDEAALQLDPSAWNGDVAAAMLECRRRENYTAINGSTAHNLLGIVGAARANPNGKITAAASSGVNVANKGNWYGTEDNAVMEPYSDLLEGVSKVSTEFSRSSLSLLGHPLDLKGLYEKDELRKDYASQIGPLFGRKEGDTSFIIACDYVPRGFVYIVPNSMDAAELVIAVDYALDANYPREKGKQVYGEVGGYIAFEFHNPRAIVEVEVA